MKLSKFYRYSRLGEELDEVKTNTYQERLAYRWNRSSVWTSRLPIIFPWLLASIFGVLSVVLWTRCTIPSSVGSYELGFTTDLRDFGHGARVPLEKVKFTGNLYFFGNGTWKEPLRQTIDELDGSEKIQYFGEYSGPPSQEIDDNWEKLVGNRYVSFSEEEAREAWGDEFPQYIDKNTGKYTAGLDVFHNLHCINYIRKGFFPDIYPRDKTYEIHRDHCIDILRQGAQCYGSTTLIPTMFMGGLHRNTIDSDQTHICRSFSFIRDWTTQRGTRGSKHVKGS